MPTEDAPPEVISVIGRVRRGLRSGQSWVQLARFSLVGASGYFLNLGTFAVCVGPLGLDHRLGALAAFLIAISNNFLWNRHWTFAAAGGRADAQAVRFVVISCVAFIGNLVALELLVSGAHVKLLAAQAIAVVVAMPLNFMGNKLWTFDV
jgi:putative flippase GtrA